MIKVEPEYSFSRELKYDSTIFINENFNYHIMNSKKYFEAKKRIDFILSAVIFIAAFPFMLLITILLAIIMRSFPLIIQKRGVTVDNQVFNLYKFKTVKIDPANRINIENILFKPDLSQYVPAFCRWLRKSGLDELPQLLNVLKGEMSLVGPRPLSISDLELLKNNYPHYYHVRNSITVKPGITGMWQVFGEREKGIKNLIHLDLYYHEHTSLFIDLRILLNTILLLARGKHTDSISYSRRSNKDSRALNGANLITNI